MYALLLEIDAWTGSGVETLRFATHTLVTSRTDTPANTIYEGRIADAGSIARSLFSAGVLDRSSTSYGYLELINADGALDPWLDYGFDGRVFRLKGLPTQGMPVSAAQTLFLGTLAGIESTDPVKTIRLRIRDRLAELAVPLLTDRYAGTTTSAGLGIEGDTDLTDAIKPRVFGTVTNVSGKAVNTYDLLWQFSAGPVAAIAVYDGAEPLTWAADYPVLSSMMDAPVSPGQYLTCLALGVVRLGGVPAGAVTADAVEAADCTAAGLVERMLDLLGIAAADRDQASFDALRAAQPAPVGLYVDGDTSALDLIGQVLGSIGAAILPNEQGLFQAIRFVEPTEAAALGELTLSDLADGATFAFVQGPESQGVPAGTVTVNYGRVWQTMSAAEVFGDVPLARKTYLARASRAATAQNAATRTAHPLASTVTVDSLLASQSDAQAEAARLLDLYGVRRDRFSWPIPMDRAPYELGDVISMRLPRFGYAAGCPMLVVGRRDDFTTRTTTLDLWGSGVPATPTPPPSTDPAAATLSLGPSAFLLIGPGVFLEL